MITREQLTEIGTITKAHGLHGEMAATMDIDAEDLAALRCVVLNVDGIFVPFFPSNARQRGSQAVLLTLDGVENDREAAALIGGTIYALRDDVAGFIDSEDDVDGVPADYFTGFTIIDKTTGQNIGTVTDVDDSTLNVLFIIKRPNGNTAHIPAAAELVNDIDHKRRVITMTIPGGLLDL